MYRILLILALFVLLYFLLRSAIRELKRTETLSKGTKGAMTDKNRMVQDPVCHVFVPRGSAVTEEIGGQTYCFCSHDCARTFKRQLSS